jgi:hypothetical protein
MTPTQPPGSAGRRTLPADGSATAGIECIRRTIKINTNADQDSKSNSIATTAITKPFTNATIKFHHANARADSRLTQQEALLGSQDGPASAL